VATKPVSLKQKTMQKERNLYQMINMLSNRLALLDQISKYSFPIFCLPTSAHGLQLVDWTVAERREAAREDLNPKSSFRSSLVRHKK
jgi:hypothetical protein